MEYYYVRVLIIVFLGIFIFLIVKAIKNLSTKNLYPKSREGFENYVCDWLSTKNLKKNSLDEVSNYIFAHYEEIAVSYTFDTGNIFLTSDLTTVLSNAARKYTSPK